MRALVFLAAVARDEFFLIHYRHSAQFMHTRIVCPLTYPTHSKRHLARICIALACALHRSAQALRVIAVVERLGAADAKTAADVAAFV